MRKDLRDGYETMDSWHKGRVKVHRLLCKRTAFPIICARKKERPLQEKGKPSWLETSRGDDSICFPKEKRFHGRKNCKFGLLDPKGELASSSGNRTDTPEGKRTEGRNGQWWGNLKGANGTRITRRLLKLGGGANRPDLTGQKEGLASR